MFPSSTELVVGPGFKEAFVPAYPTVEDSQVDERAWEGRSLREIDFDAEGNGLKLGQYKAMDFYGDGSFYLLDTPGHAIGHMCGLARTSADPPEFIFMGKY
jgi:glyoxylase-like metal-dependent hydrolase (beta-lactamase superfamily II)